MSIPSGYKTITPMQLANVLTAERAGAIGGCGLRIYFACYALVAIREAAGRQRRQRRKRPREASRYRLSELERLTGLTAPRVRRALRELDRTGLVQFAEGEIVIVRETLPGSEELQSVLSCRRSPRRPIPVPRCLLRFLARTRSESLVKTVVAYLVRGLSIARGTGEIGGKGTVKASWIAETFGLSQRAVKYAQAELRALDWISKDTQSVQRKLNRDGAYFVINLAWIFRREEGCGHSQGDAIVNRNKHDTRFAPPRTKIAPVFAPPIEDQETSIERDQYRETQGAEPRVPGVFGEGKGTGSWQPPSLKNIRREDLFHFSRLESLYFEAVESGWVNQSEAMALNFIAAAVKAREEGNDPARLFVSLVRRGLWHHLNQGHEDRARVALNRHRQESPERFRPPSGGSRRSDDSRAG